MLLLQDEKEESEGSNKLLSQTDIGTSRIENTRNVAELKEDYDVLKDIKGVDLLAKEFQVHDTCKREYLRYYSSNTSTYRNGNENTAMNSEGSDFEAVKMP